MGRSRALLLALVLAVAAALTLAACGEEDAELLPGKTAVAINENLDSVEQLVAEEDCVGAADAAAQVSVQIEELSGVDRDLKQALERGAARLNEVVDQCTEAPEEDEEETVPLEEEPSEDELREDDREQKAQEKAEKDAEKDQKKEEKTEEKETPPVEPPGQEEKGTEPPASEEGGGTPSGGVSPSAPVGGDE